MSVKIISKERERKGAYEQKVVLFAKHFAQTYQNLSEKENASVITVVILKDPIQVP